MLVSCVQRLGREGNVLGHGTMQQLLAERMLLSTYCIALMSKARPGEILAFGAPAFPRPGIEAGFFN